MLREGSCIGQGHYVKRVRETAEEMLFVRHFLRRVLQTGVYDGMVSFLIFPHGCLVFLPELRRLLPRISHHRFQWLCLSPVGTGCQQEKGSYYYCWFHDCWFLDCHGPDGPRNDVMNGRFDVMITTVCSPTRCGFPCRHRSLSPESRSPESIWLPAGLHCSSDIPPQGK